MDTDEPRIIPSPVCYPTRIFLIAAPLLYLAFAILTPPFQTPDEHQHLFRAYQLSSLQLIGERRGRESGGALPASLAGAASREIGDPTPHVPVRPRIKATLGDRLGRSTPLENHEPWRFTNFLGAVTYAPAGYGPQVIAVWIGRALDLSVETIVRLGRILNSALTIALLHVAFRTLPAGRALLLVIALFPMTAACSASFGQDGLIIGGSALLTALGLRASATGRWEKRSAFVAGLMACLITLTKVVYLPLAGLALLPVPSKGELWRWARVPVFAAMVALSLTALWLHAIAGLFVPMQLGMPAPTDQVSHLLHHPATIANIMIDTYRERTSYLLQMLFLFGWLNVGPIRSAAFPCLAALLVSLWHGDESARLMTWSWRAWALFVSLMVVVLMTLALYVLGASAGETIVLAVQGRYFIPIALAVLLPLLRQHKGDERLATAAIAVLSGIANLIVLAAIYEAFYA
jgi:uncharacterized membrane protein